MHAPIHVTINRLTSDDEGTFGVLGIQSLGWTCLTLEPPQRNNTPMRSCIPHGIYNVEWTWSNRFNNHYYRLLEVPGRVGILIHAGNFAGDTNLGFASHSSGCIMLGQQREQRQRPGAAAQWALKKSAPTLAEFYSVTQKRPLIITINDKTPKAG